MVNFIERWFGLSPDAGSGSFETMLLVLPLLCLAMVMLGRVRHLLRRHVIEQNCCPVHRVRPASRIFRPSRCR